MNERILVLVRAIPEKSERYGYLICVAGINEKSEWRRLYPFKFSYGERLVDFGKKDLINVTLANPDNDKRSESRKVITHENLNSKLNDEEILQRIIPLVSSIEILKKEDASLGVIKPELTGIDVIINSTDIYDQQTYFSLADDYLEKREKVKMPVELRYQFKCKDEPECKGHNIILIDWELNELARNVMRREKDKKIIEDPTFRTSNTFGIKLSTNVLVYKQIRFENILNSLNSIPFVPSAECGENPKHIFNNH